MRSSRLLFCSVVCLLLAGTLPAFSVSLTALEAFQNANQAYNATNYERAVRLYETAAEMKYRPAALYYNLGNAYYRRGKLGHAIAAYRRAVWLQPRDADVRENLSIARSQTEDGLSLKTLPDTVKSFLFLYYYIGFDELIWGCASLSALFFLLATLYLFIPRRPLRTLLVILACATLVLAVTVGLHCYDRFYLRDAVVISEQAPVRAGPLDSYSEMFILHDGAEARVLEQQDSWVKIQVVIAEQKKRGWINRADITLI